MIALAIGFGSFFALWGICKLIDRRCQKPMR